MKKFNKILILAFVAIVIVAAMPFAVSAETLKVTLRVEGIEANLFYGTVEYESGDKAVTAADIIDKAAEDNESLTVVGASAGYITSVNGIDGGKYGGWDGWMYRVNDIEASVGVNEYEVKNGDVIVLYYSDAFGAGMQYPELDTSKLSEGVIKVTSKDTTYDASYNPTVTVNPVVGATLKFDGNTYTTDEKGEVKIDASLLTAGSHKVAVEKYAENGCPTVLRLAPDAKVRIAAQDQGNDHVKAGDNGVMVYIIIAAAAFGLLCAVLVSAKKSRKNELD